MRQKDAEGVGDHGDLHGEAAQPLAVGLKVRRMSSDGTAGEGIDVHAVEKWIDARHAEPAGEEPKRQGKPCGRREDVKVQCGVANRCAPAGEPGEKSAEAVDAGGHDAHGGADNAVTECGRFVFDFERMETVRRKEACGVEVVRKAAELRFVTGDEAVDERAIGTDAGHDGEVSNRAGANDSADGNDARGAAQLLEGCRGRVERKAQMPGKRVGATERNDAENAGGHFVFGDEALQDFMHGAVTAAGKDHISGGQGSLARLGSGGCGAGG